MINVTISSNTNRTSVAVEATATVLDVYEAAGMAVGNTAVYLNGVVVSRDELDESLEDLGVEDFSNATLINVVKADSAR